MPQYVVRNCSISPFFVPDAVFATFRLSLLIQALIGELKRVLDLYGDKNSQGKKNRGEMGKSLGMMSKLQYNRWDW